jgi:hypothetical protein
MNSTGVGALERPSEMMNIAKAANTGNSGELSPATPTGGRPAALDPGPGV